MSSDSSSPFYETPDMRTVYAKNAQRILHPDSVRLAPLMVSSDTARISAQVSGAYPYMLSFLLARYFTQHQATVHDTGWPCEQSLHLLTGHLTFSRPRWDKIVETAWERYLSYIEGEDISLERIAICAQYLGHLEGLSARPYQSFYPDFRHQDAVTKDLVSLGQLLEPRVFGDVKVLNLSPKSVLGQAFNSGIGDMSYDGTLVSIKTSSKISPPLQQLRELAFQSVLQKMGGTALPEEGVDMTPTTHLAIYYARFDIYARWSLDEIFKDNYDNYTSIIQREIENVTLSQSSQPTP